MHSNFIEANGLRFHYVSQGEGKLILLLHGFPEFWYSWKKVIPLLSAGNKVVAPDMRGYGQTAKPQNIADYNYKTLAKDIADLIKGLGYTKAYIVGHDWGGGVAWEFAKLYPEMTEKLIVLNCPPAVKLQREIFTSFSQFKKSWYVFFFQLPFLPERWLLKSRDTFFWRAMKGKAINKAAFTKEDITQYINTFKSVEDFKGPINYFSGQAIIQNLFNVAWLYVYQLRFFCNFKLGWHLHPPPLQVMLSLCSATNLINSGL
jgi:pimeloyl-ACP methyl ester carboxylesterase